VSNVASLRDVIRTINPSSGEQLEQYELHSSDEMEGFLASAVAAGSAWSVTPLSDRITLLKDLADYFRANKPQLARLITTEMGKAIMEAEAEIEKCAWACEYYASHAPAQLASRHVESSASVSYVAYRPMGCVLAVMPWNFPFFQVVRFAIPALAAGNVVLLKHAGNVTGCGLALEQTFRASGFPKGTFTTLVVRASAVNDLIADPRIAAVTLTGSEPAGSSVAAAAGKHLKKTVLELGGSDSYIVLQDADVQAAAKTAVRARFQNCGQSCIAAKRFIVEAPVYEDFCNAFVEGARQLNVGDPLDRSVAMGPLARHDLVDELERQVNASASAGARILTGGRRISGPGAFYEPTIVADVGREMAMFREETFGPAAAVTQVRDADEAIALANATTFGLGNNVWTRNTGIAENVAARLQSGLVFFNGMVASDPRLPFGGVKKSGYGRELAEFGLREFTNVQTVWIG
jgi:succinate-semialdehyde dehydrogenase / glutarate-semialdehyde dehydrogenase